MATNQTLKKPILLGFDLGSKSLGIALSNRLGMIMPLPAWFFSRLDENQLIQFLQDLIENHHPDRFVFGVPYHASGLPSEQTQWVLGVIGRLKKVFSLPIESVDERWTTIEAKSRLHELGIPEKKQKPYLDSVSACIILEQYGKSSR
jgi:putative holliday junction resolvase